MAVLAFVFAGSSTATTGGTFNWNGVNGATACAPGTTGTILWIFNPHSDAVPTSLTITWSDNTTQTYTGDWTNPGNSQNWHDTETIVGAFPPQSASLTYTGTLGSNPILTISGCNEGGGNTPPAAAPTVSKTASQNANTEYGWGITKAVDKHEIDPTPGGTATFHYTVTLTGTPGTPTIGDVTGTITVFNNAGGDIALSTLTDQLSDGTVCTVDTTTNPTLTIPANGSYDFPYSCGLSAAPTDSPNTTNTVTMTWGDQILSDQTELAAGTASDSVPVDFTTSVTDNCATATDSFNGGLADPLGTYCADTGSADTSLVTLPNFAEVYTTPPPKWTLTYTRTVNAPPLGSCVAANNEADFADNSVPQNTGSASVTAQVCTFNAPLTIGYWKNHLAKNGTSGCSSGLPSGTGCSANGPWTKDGLGHTICTSASCPTGIVVGNLGNTTITTFQQAAKVFSNNNCSNASSSDSNAAACLAAQLLGAELNIWNVANPCACSAIKNAIALLAAVNYNPITNTSHFGGSGYTRAQALALKTALDNYNNGLGCS